MIRVIASDMDGTLLQGGIRKPSNEMFDLIRELKERGVLFVAASGRQYPNLRRLFEPVANDVAFICCNGALGMYQEKEIFHQPIERQFGEIVIRDIMKRDGLEVLIDGRQTSYIQPKTMEYQHLLTDVVCNTVTVLDDALSSTEDYLKISVYEKAGIAKGAGDYFLKKYQGQASIAISGHEWMDFTAVGVNKGMAMTKIMGKMGINRSESMAFGDNFNDVEMLREVQYGYVMEKAHPAVRAVSPYSCHRVEDTLTELLREGSLFEER